MMPGTARLPLRRNRAAELAPLAALGLVAYALKAHYAVASPEQLRFILAPTAALIALLTGAPWSFEAGVGYVSTAHATAIVPACAGVNFWIVAIVTIVVAGSTRRRGASANLALLACALPLGYGCTVVVNALRIGCDLVLRELTLAPAVHVEAHRVLGVVVYLGSAMLLYALASGSPGAARGSRAE